MTGEWIDRASHAQVSLVATVGDDGRSAVNVVTAVRITGPLDLERLRRALGALATRHEALRTRLAYTDDGVAQVIRASADATPVVIDLSASDDPGAALGHFLRDEQRQPFTIVGGDLARAAILTLAPGDHAVVLTLHHAVCDGWSRGVLAHDLETLYRSPAALHGVRVTQPRAHAEREQRVSDDVVREWAERLYDHRARLSLPLPLPQPPRPAYAEVAAPFEVPTLPRGLDDLAKALRAPTGAVLLAAVAASLGGYAGERPIVGMMMANRADDAEAAAVGCFADYLPVPLDLSQDPTWDELVEQATDQLFRGMERWAPIGRLRSLLADDSGPLLDVCLNYQPYAVGDPLPRQSGGPSFALVEPPQVATLAHGWWDAATMLEYRVSGLPRGRSVSTIGAHVEIPGAFVRQRGRLFAEAMRQMAGRSQARVSALGASAEQASR